MNLQYRCGTHMRKAKLEGSAANGIDYLEVDADQVHLHVHFVNPITVALTPDNIAIEGGVRIKGIRVDDVAVSAADNKVLEVTASAAGDFSIYRLRLQKGIGNAATLDGYDQVLSTVSFSFRAACPSDFDCLIDQVCSTAALPSPVIDYLSKDYASFRRLMLDRLAVTVPDWTERNPADVLVTLVELLAYVGDDLSYRQDAVAAEAFLGTCRLRTSARRHARLLDYHMHEGCNARTWIQFTTNVPILFVDKGTQVISGTPDQDPRVPSLDSLADQSFVVFETMHALNARKDHAEIRFWTWGETSCSLSPGATAATLVRTAAMSLAPGDFLLLEELRGVRSGKLVDADPSHRQIVRITSAIDNSDNLYGIDVVDVEWDRADALAFQLCLSAVTSGQGGQTGGAVVADMAIARANLALADHGRSLRAQRIDPGTVGDEGLFAPTLRRHDLTFAVALTEEEAKPASKVPASALAVAEPTMALPAATLTSPTGTWSAQSDLLDSDRFSLDFVVEMEDDRVAHLRFGDDVHGRRPKPGDSFAADYRVGSGTDGNVGRDTLRRIVGVPDVTAVTNPLPAVGGRDPELLEAVKQLAPQAFRKQDRAVTEADYREVAGRHPQVLSAAARMRWTGSWWTVFLTVERRDGLDVDTAFRLELAQFVDRFRLAGYDVEVEGPIYVPLDIALAFCPRDGFFAEDVRQAIIAALTGRPSSAAQAPFFSPERFAFGQAVYLSRVYQAVLEVPGVASAAVTRFQRWGKAPNQELEDGRIAVAPLEVIRLANDPNFPENGRLEIVLGGAA